MTITNPILWADMPDPDVIRVGDTYYMVSTTMFMMPGGPILKSKDLYHWEVVSYIFNKTEENDIYNLENGRNAYGKGQWATSLKYYRGRFYACFVCHDMQRTYIYYTEDIEKSGWDRFVMEDVYHDMSFMLDDEGAYLIYGNGDIYIVELKDDLSGVKEGGANRLLVHTPSENMRLRCEGCRAYRTQGYYYLLFIDWPKDGYGRRRVVCYRSKELLGEYEGKILLDDDMGYQNMGIAQGTLIDTPSGEWYSILFQDHGAVGRIPCLIPVSWENGWPMIGLNGKVPETFEVPFTEYAAKPLIISDSFHHPENVLDLQWQWNHNPEVGCWSLTERTGYLRIYTKTLATDILAARNTLTQRTSGPKCNFTVELETDGMKPGDFAGLVALQGHYGAIGVKLDEKGTRRIVVCKKDNCLRQFEEAFYEISKGSPAPLQGVFLARRAKKHDISGGFQLQTSNGVASPSEAPMFSSAEQVHLFTQSRIYLKVMFDFENSIDIATFHYSEDGLLWKKLGSDLHMKYTLDLFIGYRIGLFFYSEKEAGGFADFRNFTYEKRGYAT